jgi:2-polyprenyl-6-methoxyphenol hydroxylase-like FAD-dependent oxidoreductase
MATPDVLVVGAGPTGLTLACELAACGATVRIVDRDPEPSRHSKALGVHARTLELLARHGLDAGMVDCGIALRAGVARLDGRAVAHIRIGDSGTPFPFILSLPQSETERLLVTRLEALGIQVERPVEAVALEERSEGWAVTLRFSNGSEERMDVPWVCGCDGARSFVRRSLGFAFEGERYEETFDLVDLQVAWDLPRDRVQVFLSQEGLAFVVPLPGKATFRIIFDHPPGFQGDGRLAEADLQSLMGLRLPAPLTRGGFDRLLWSSRFRIHRRMVTCLRSGRAFLAGDAAHLHSPAGAQGMNSGIQDAVNLGWKLAGVCLGHLRPAVLDSYDGERRPIARKILQGTHFGTKMMTGRGPMKTVMRIAGLMAVAGIEPVQRRISRVAMNLDLHYRESPIAVDDRSLGDKVLGLTDPTRVFAGDRVPHPSVGEGRLSDLLAPFEWTLLLFPGRSPTVRQMERLIRVASGALDRHPHLQTLFVLPPSLFSGEPGEVLDENWAAHSAFGCEFGGCCLIRPDHYIGALFRRGAEHQVLRYLAAVGAPAATGDSSIGSSGVETQ